VVYDACRSAVTDKRLLADVLVELPEIVDALGSTDAIRHHCDPANYLGLAPQMVDHMLSHLAGKAAAGQPASAR
jgi:3-carboxy-cis,cis-muconate cycloisomerase